LLGSLGTGRGGIRNDVETPVIVNVANHEGIRAGPNGKRRAWREGESTAAIAEGYRDVIVGVIDGCQIEFAIAVQVG
jgi:hypothetical protein